MVSQPFALARFPGQTLQFSSALFMGILSLKLCRWWSISCPICLTWYSQMGEGALPLCWEDNSFCLVDGGSEEMTTKELCWHLASSLKCHNLSRTCTEYFSKCYFGFQIHRSKSIKPLNWHHPSTGSQGNNSQHQNHMRGRLAWSSWSAGEMPRIDWLLMRNRVSCSVVQEKGLLDVYTCLQHKCIAY